MTILKQLLHLNHCLEEEQENSFKHSSKKGDQEIL